MSDAPGTDPGGPFEEQREVYDLLSQETRHLVLQFILAHSEHLPSLDELAYLIPKNKAAIRDQVQRLEEEGIVKRYDYSPNEDARDLPSQFYGLTEYGVNILDEYNYLSGLPVARAIYDNTRLSEKAERHRDAPRPELPVAVENALRIDGDDDRNFDRLDQYIRKRNAATSSLDDQIEVAKAFFRNDIGPDHDGVTRTELMGELDIDLDYQLQTVLDNLAEIGILEEFQPPGPNVFPISERNDEIVLGEVEDETERNIQALIEHIDDELQTVKLEDDAAELSDQDTSKTPSVARADGAGTKIRSILAREFGVAPEDVTDYLQAGDPISRLNTAVEAIESSEAVTKAEEYGRILFVSSANRYRLSETAVELV